MYNGYLTTSGAVNPLGYGIDPKGAQDPFQHLVNAGYLSGTRYSGTETDVNGTPLSSYAAFSFWFNSGQYDLDRGYVLLLLRVGS